MLVTGEIVDTTSIARWVIIVFQPFHGRQKGPEVYGTMSMSAYKQRGGWIKVNHVRSARSA